RCPHVRVAPRWLQCDVRQSRPHSPTVASRTHYLDSRQCHRRGGMFSSPPQTGRTLPCSKRDTDLYRSTESVARRQSRDLSVSSPESTPVVSPHAGSPATMRLLTIAVHCR